MFPHNYMLFIILTFWLSLHVIMMTGGFTPDFTTLDRILQYNSSLDVWEETGRMIQGRYRRPAVATVQNVQLLCNWRYISDLLFVQFAIKLTFLLWIVKFVHTIKVNFPSEYQSDIKCSLFPVNYKYIKADSEERLPWGYEDLGEKRRR